MPTAIRVHPENPRIFEFRGKPLVLVCATEHYGAVLNRPFDFRTYLADAAEKRQTLTRLFLLFRELQSAVNPYSTCKPESPDYVSPFVRTGPGRALDGEPKFDLDQWNPEFFERLHAFLSLASEYGIIVEVTLFCDNGEHPWSLNPFNSRNNINAVEEDIDWSEYVSGRHPRLFERQLQYLQKIVEETNRYDNIIYEVCNEPGGDYPQKPKGASPEEVNDWQMAIAEKIRQVEASLSLKHLVVGQEAWSWNPFEQPADAAFREMSFDVVNIHPIVDTTYGGKSYDMGAFMSKQLRLRGVRDYCLATKDESKPLNMDEDNAASQYKDFDGWTIHRKRAWTTLLSGCHYDYIDFSIINYAPTGTPQSQRYIRSWMKHLSNYIHSVDLVRVRAKPLIGWLTEQPEHTLESILAVEGEEYSVYVADERELGEGVGAPIIGYLSFELPSGQYETSFYLPVTGMYSPSISLEGGGLTRIPVPKFEQDLVLRVTRKP